MQKHYRLACLTSHPIQYQVPLFRAISISPEIKLTVFFCSEWGMKEYEDSGFGKSFKWDIPLTGGYSYKVLPNRSFSPGLSNFWGLVNPSIVDYLKQEEIDGIWVHGWARFTNWLAMFVAFYRGIPVFMRGETTLISPLPWWKSKLKYFIFSKIFKRITAFFAIGRYNAEFYKAYGVPDEKIFLVPYTVDNEFFIKKAEELLPQKNKLKSEFGITPEIPVILFSGKLTSVKRPMDLLKAFEQLSKNINSALVFVGDGQLRPDLEKYVKENKIKQVYFAGFQNQTQLPRFYAMADIFVLPSGTEPWGLVVNEAMCFSLPVIVSDQVGAGGDLVKDGLNGYIYRTGDEELLANRMRLLISNDVLRDNMGKTSHTMIEKWSYQQAVEGILSCLKMIKNRMPH